MMRKLKVLFSLVFHGAYDINSIEGRANERNRRIALTAFTGAMAKLLAMSIPLVTIKITYHYLGEELYGLWGAITSFFAIFQFADLGLGNGLKTRLSQAQGHEDTNLSRKLISSTSLMLIVVATLLILAFFIFYPIIDWSKVMNAKSEKAILLGGGFVFAIVTSRILMIPLSLVERTQLSLQEGFRSNVWQIVAFILSLISVYLIAGLDLGPLPMIWVSSYIVVLVSGINMLVYFYFQRREYCPSIHMVDTKITKLMLKTGSNFFVLSIFTAIGLSLDNFIVAKTISLNEVATYSILFKITIMIGGITTMISAPMWTANGEAYARGEFQWIIKNTKRMALILFGISLIASIGLVIISKPFFKLWMGTDFNFSIFLLIGMCTLQILLSVATSYFMVLNALGKVRIQIILFTVYTSVSLILKYYLSLKYGSIVIPWIGSLSYLIIILIPVVVILDKLFKKMNSN